MFKKENNRPLTDDGTKRPLNILEAVSKNDFRDNSVQTPLKSSVAWLFQKTPQKGPIF